MKYLDDIDKFSIKGTIKTGYKTIAANCSKCHKTIKAIKPHNNFVCPQCGQLVEPLPGAKESTVSTSYFVVPEEVKVVTGDKPTLLRIIPAYKEVYRTFPTSYAKYASNKMIFCSSKDGITARRYDRVAGYKEVPCSDECIDRINKTCKLTATFYVILPDVDILNAYKIIPKSVQSIYNIRAALNKLKNSENQIVRTICTLELIKKKKRDTNTDYYIIQMNLPAVNLTSLKNFKNSEDTALIEML